MKTYNTYILASINCVIYVGVTNDLERRVAEHRSKKHEGFTAKYNVNRLVWYEVFRNIRDAIGAEKRIKGWTRNKKVILIENSNPLWDDLAAGWAPFGHPATSTTEGLSPHLTPRQDNRSLPDEGSPNTASKPVRLSSPSPILARSFGVPQDDNLGPVEKGVR